MSEFRIACIGALVGHCVFGLLCLLLGNLGPNGLTLACMFMVWGALIAVACGGKRAA